MRVKQEAQRRKKVVRTESSTDFNKDLNKDFNKDVACDVSKGCICKLSEVLSKNVGLSPEASNL